VHKPILEIVTVGLPFCAFKIITGLFLIPKIPALGWPLLVLGIMDLGINSANLFTYTLKRQNLTSPCLFAVITNHLRRDQAPAWTWQNLGNSLDMLLAMTLVAGIIGSGAVGALTRNQLLVWNISVILNVMGAGLTRVGHSIAHLGDGPDSDRRDNA
jgi:hypothetical protein